MSNDVGVAGSKMLEIAKEFAKVQDNDPESKEFKAKHQKMITATNNLKNVSSEAVAIVNRRKLFEKLGNLKIFQIKPNECLHFNRFIGNESSRRWRQVFNSLQ